jgi:hypothetical protein
MEVKISEGTNGRDFLVSQQNTTAGKLKRLRLFPMHIITAYLGISTLLHDLRTRRATAILKRRDHERLIASHDGEALQQDSADLVYLYDRVIGSKPVRAIEFGSGQTTVFIAQALHDLGHGHLWSLDSEARWLANTEASLPDHLRPFVTFVHSPVMVHHDYGVPAFRYSVVPPGEWDFVLIDGPALDPQVRLSTDLIDLRLRKGATGMIDHRWRSAALAKEVAGDRLKLRFMPSLESFAVSAA